MRNIHQLWMIHNAHPLTLCADKAPDEKLKINELGPYLLISGFSVKWRIRLSVANLSSENNVANFLLNALVAIRVKVKMCEQTLYVLFSHAPLKTNHWRSKVGKDCSPLTASSSWWSRDLTVAASCSLAQVLLMLLHWLLECYFHSTLKDKLSCSSQLRSLWKQALRDEYNN